MATPAPNTKAFWIQALSKQVPDCDAKPAELEKLTLAQLKIFCAKQGLNLTETVQLYHREKGRAKRAAAEAEAKASGTADDNESIKSASTLASLNLNQEFDDWEPPVSEPTQQPKSLPKEQQLREDKPTEIQLALPKTGDSKIVNITIHFQ